MDALPGLSVRQEEKPLAKLYFRYGAMGAGKTAHAILLLNGYLERGRKALMLKPRLETRDGERTVRSRSGLCAACEYVEDLKRIPVCEYDCLIVDEAQFLTQEQVRLLADIADEQDVQVIAYGLRTDFQGNLFEGSRWLMALADTIEEIKSICWCGRKAICNARMQNGAVVRTGEQILLGGSESYISLCRKHWKEGRLG